MKLQRLLCFHKELTAQKEKLADACHFTIWPNDQTAYDIRIDTSGFFYRDGSDSTTGFSGSEPIAYKKLVGIIFKYDNPSGSHDIINDFVKKFFSIGGSVPDRWLSKVNEIIEKPISDEEYASIEEIIANNKKRTALGWLAKVEKFSHSRLYYRPTAEGYIKKAQLLWPQINISETEQIIKKKEN